jgi:hypothetical protein
MIVELGEKIKKEEEKCSMWIPNVGYSGIIGEWSR